MSEMKPEYLRAKSRAVERAHEQGAEPREAPSSERLPPGQSLTRKFPVLDLGIQPPWDPATWSLTVGGLVENPMCWSWAEFRQLPRVSRVTDFHCVTRWSKFDVRWDGVLFKTIADLVKPVPASRFVLQRSDDGYSSNLPLEEMMRDDVLLADELDGEPLPLEHGGPLRIIVPHLYAWKGAKFLRSIEFMETDQPGFWETRGYHNHGDPWKEERFSGEWWR
jgi:DMSO/TMAO reductase YedYZ molybdopterin-dependent catalytic subunit